MKHVKRDSWNISKEKHQTFQKTPRCQVVAACVWGNERVTGDLWNMSKETYEICQKRPMKYVNRDLWNLSKDSSMSHCCCLRFRKWNVSRETYQICQKRPIKYVKRDLWNVSIESKKIFQERSMKYFKRKYESCQKAPPFPLLLPAFEKMKRVKRDLWNMSKETYNIHVKRDLWNKLSLVSVLLIRFLCWMYGFFLLF